MGNLTNDETMPSDILITVEATGAVPAKYLQATTTVIFPFGVNGPAQLSSKFNLTAYVRDMIAEATGTT